MSKSAKENIFNKIKKALKHPTSMPFSTIPSSQLHYTNANQELAIEFAQNFVALQGKFTYCSSETEFIEMLTQLIQVRKWTAIYCLEKSILALLLRNNTLSVVDTELTSCNASITSCSQLIARTGSILMTSTTESGRATSIYAPIHICLAYTDQIVFDIADALSPFQNSDSNLQFPSLITLASGPSRTADIEKTLVTGVHGPKEVFCFLVER